MKDRNSFNHLAIGIALGALAMFSLAATTSKHNDDVLRVRKLIIVDDKGRDRIVIASPVPDPKVMGKVTPRRVPGTGIQINDTNGNERGGMALLDDGTFLVGIDDDSCRERAHLYFIPQRGAGLYVQDGKDQAHVSMLIPTTGQHPGRPEFEMTDENGKTTQRFPASN
jgi:hypothetical protein